jgi:hypothetical protein
MFWNYLIHDANDVWVVHKFENERIIADGNIDHMFQHITENKTEYNR